MKKEFSPFIRIMIAVAFFLLVLAVWQIVATIIDKEYMMPSPLNICIRFWELHTELFAVHFLVTMKVVAIGGCFSIVFGVLLAIIMDSSSIIERSLNPILTVLQTVPIMCVSPLLVVWFGYTELTRILIVILMCFFGVTINVFDGLKATRTDMQDLLKTFNAGPIQIFWMLRIPTAIPYFFSAVKITLPWAVVGAAIAEWLGANAGLGYYSRYLMSKFDAAGLFAPIILITAVALIITAIVGLIEKKVIHWNNEF